MFGYFDTFTVDPQLMNHFELDTLLGVVFPDPPGPQLDIQPALQLPEPTSITNELESLHRTPFVPNPPVDQSALPSVTLLNFAEPQHSAFTASIPHPLLRPLYSPAFNILGPSFLLEETAGGGQFAVLPPSNTLPNIDSSVPHPLLRPMTSTPFNVFDTSSLLFEETTGGGPSKFNASRSRDATNAIHPTARFTFRHSSGRCPKCKKVFLGNGYQSDLVNHFHLQCPVPTCTKQISFHNWISNMSDHLQSHVQDKVHPCPSPGCNKKFMYRADSEKCRRTHEENKVRCYRCLQEFMNPYARDRHRKDARRRRTQCIPVPRPRRRVMHRKPSLTRNEF
ncbi:hypothetical protein BCR33DRAFT_724723 [Rhizoclosmatium globosum]|uniref:C2H2-type domain-containing protein n=1 Tax=Rhizoclosmatium globosum TaxID=329046 RepID=A0A1Y2B3T2_9FUNG|nr:hypothetical protein BCR33DRAFT_724723 [Rhizoclosmatium globosum]|eukprot:ORY29481.1 hypothetical protein BCR33DRAFT_724723 [Rhizoclosmatium globosum]